MYASELDVIFTGFFHIDFAGDQEPRRVRITDVVRTSDDHILFLRDDKGTIYNWYTVISMTKIKE